MAYRIRRVLLRSGQILKERDLDAVCPVVEGHPPGLGDTMTVSLFGRRVPVEVIWGDWAGRTGDPVAVVPLRVKEV